MSDRIELIRRAFDGRAADYDDSTMHRTLAADVADAVDLDGARTVLDIATGTGLVLRALAQRADGIRLIGIDISSSMLAVAERALPVAEWITAEATQLPLLPASMDIAICVTALHIIPDVPAALDEWHRVLRPGGRLITATFSSEYRSGIPKASTNRTYPSDHDPYASVPAISATLAPHGFGLRAHRNWTDGTDAVLIAEFVAESRP
ncbi:methyltransferase domain-containing protein [Microbacterium sp. LWH10-1.2]|uniref:class I SAM-dependent methyltransferase n=1 Tax=Microbacterium sp. LWH10-1.2 TaxID=3135255 RepID=UPI003138BD06